MKHLVLRAISLYQQTLSPDHGWFKHNHPYGFCRYYPSCSEYTKQAVTGRGVFRGLLLGAWRVLRCNPFSRGGLDPVTPQV